MCFQYFAFPATWEKSLCKTPVSGHALANSGIQEPAPTMRTSLTLMGLLALTVAGNAQTQFSTSPSNMPPSNAAPASPATSNPLTAAPTAGTVTAPANSTAAATGKEAPGYDPLLDLPPLPHNKVALTSGTVTKVDAVLNRITIRPFGSKQQMHLSFDTRSHIYRNGTLVAPHDVRTGDRVDIDTMLDGTHIFAKTIHVREAGLGGYAHGQILNYYAAASSLSVRDDLTDQEVHFRLSPQTVIRNGSEVRTAADLKTGALVSLDFGTEPGVSVARNISVLAEPGAAFTFSGKITFLDLSRKVIAVNNQSDGRTYEIYLAAIGRDVIQDLHEGKDVTISAIFDGKQYSANSVTLAQ